jgi:hypothetical protein
MIRLKSAVDVSSQMPGKCRQTDLEKEKGGTESLTKAHKVEARFFELEVPICDSNDQFELSGVVEGRNRF